MATKVAADRNDAMTASWNLWVRLRRRFGSAITLIDLYELEALRRGIPPEALPDRDRAALVSLWSRETHPAWQRVANSSRRFDPIRLEQYDQSWPEQFRSWRDSLVRVLGDAVVDVSHVGSTAVPGLVAKPIVDIQVAVVDVEYEASYRPGIESLGFELYSREPGHRLFFPLPDRPRQTHVHVCQSGGVWEAEHLAFRDRLRADPALRAEYAKLKLSLVKRFPRDRLAYTEAKTGFVHAAIHDGLVR